jgi:hypothetical protein
MSPSEAELRAALRAGEGSRVDPDSVIRAAVAAKRQRRIRTAAVSGAVLAVVGIAATVTAVNLGGSGSGRHSAAAPATAGPSRSGTVSASPQPDSAPSGPVPAACPATPSAIVAPGGLLPGSAGRLFPGGIVALRICVYRSDPAHQPDVLMSSRLLDAAVSRSLADQFNALPSQPVALPCPITLIARSVLIEGTTSTGAINPVLGRTDGCGVATNGSVKRLAGNILRNLAAGELRPAPSSANNSPGPGPS